MPHAENELKIAEFELSVPFLFPQFCHYFWRKVKENY
jgi:hypothetical protein